MNLIVKGRLLADWGARKSGETVEVDSVRARAMVERGELDLAFETEPGPTMTVVVESDPEAPAPRSRRRHRAGGEE